jgi:hypothetical protein
LLRAQPGVLSIRRDGALGAVPPDEEELDADADRSGAAASVDAPMAGEPAALAVEAASDSLDSLMLLVDYSGDERGMADLLTVLVSNGVTVSRFAEQSSDLEDIFMQVTKGIVQ